MSGGAVLVLDASTGAMVRTRRLEASNHNAIFSPNGREIWTALLQEEGAVLVLDAETLETRSTVKVIDPRTLDVVRTYDLGFTPGVVAVPPAQKTTYG